MTLAGRRPRGTYRPLRPRFPTRVRIAAAAAAAAAYPLLHRILASIRGQSRRFVIWKKIRCCGSSVDGTRLASSDEVFSGAGERRRLRPLLSPSASSASSSRSTPAGCALRRFPSTHKHTNIPTHSHRYPNPGTKRESEIQVVRSLLSLCEAHLRAPGQQARPRALLLWRDMLHHECSLRYQCLSHHRVSVRSGGTPCSQPSATANAYCLPGRAPSGTLTDNMKPKYTI